MSEIKFTCIPFTRVKEEILKGSGQRTAIHVALREMLGERYDVDFVCALDVGIDKHPFDPEHVMLSVAEGESFAVHTDDGRLLAAGRREKMYYEEKNLYLPDAVSCLHTQCLSHADLEMDRLFLPKRVFLATGCFEGLAASEIIYPEEGFEAYPGYIPDRAFAKSKLTHMKIWDGAWHIGDGAFKDCRLLKTVSLPKSLSFISGGAFHGCPHDLHIIFRGTKAEWDAVRKQAPEVTSEMHYDNSRTDHDWGAEYHTDGWIDFDTYTVEFTEE